MNELISQQPPTESELPTINDDNIKYGPWHHRMGPRKPPPSLLNPFLIPAFTQESEQPSHPTLFDPDHPPVAEDQSSKISPPRPTQPSLFSPDNVRSGLGPPSGITFVFAPGPSQGKNSRDARQVIIVPK